MAETETSFPSAEILLARRFQQLVLNHEEQAHLYISRKGELGQDEVTSEIPAIDLSKVSPSRSDPSYDQQELHNLRSALSVWGCFQAVGHGISTNCLDEVRRVAREFFHLPMEEKKKIAKGVEEMEGYGADPVPAKEYPGRLYDEDESVIIQRQPKVKYSVFSGTLDPVFKWRVLTHSDRDRISVAAFYSPEPNKEIGPADGLTKGIQEYEGAMLIYIGVTTSKP